ncbi:MAG: LysR family transcriptional regulator [Peptostreptococcaceae bacterium]|jgi:DNA-binding transcriptional LysR family regulator|nr:LysR family transcriptional regulator [Peptostreptococcaceae bacterium]
MNLEYLKSFYETVNQNSISKAAKELHLTQPALSLQLKNLEKELNAKLLIRSNKGVSLTDEGQVVYDYANTLLSIQGNIKRDLINLKQEIPTLIIGSCKSVGEYALPCSIYTFKKLHKEVDINMQVSNSISVLNQLKNHEINIGIIQIDAVDYDDIKTQTIVSDELVLIGSYKKDSTKIDLEELKQIPIILREDDSGSKIILQKALKEKNIDINELNIIYSLNSIEAIKSSIISKKGFAFLPKLSIMQELKENWVSIIGINDLDISFEYFIASRKNYKFSSYEEDFIDFIISSKRGFC